jgi:hypothetical protein
MVASINNIFFNILGQSSRLIIENIDLQAKNEMV